MATMAQDRELRELARLMDKKLKRIYGERMGFLLIATPFRDEAGAIADYVGNIQRPDAIASLRDTADRLEQRATVTEPVGGLQ